MNIEFSSNLKYSLVNSTENAEKNNVFFKKWKENSEYIPFYSILLGSNFSNPEKIHLDVLTKLNKKENIKGLVKDLLLVGLTNLKKQKEENPDEIIDGNKLVELVLNFVKDWVKKEPNSQIITYASFNSISSINGYLAYNSLNLTKPINVLYQNSKKVIIHNLFFYHEVHGILHSLVIKKENVRKAKMFYVLNGYWNPEHLEFWIRKDYLDFSEKFLSQKVALEFKKCISELGLEDKTTIVDDFKSIYNTSNFNFKTITERKTFLTTLENSVKENVNLQLKMIEDARKVEILKAKKSLKRKGLILVE